MASCKIHSRFLVQKISCKNTTDSGGIYTVLLVLFAVKFVLMASRKIAKVSKKDKLSNTRGSRKLLVFFDRKLITGGLILLVLIGAQIPLLIPSLINISTASFDTTSDKINFLISLLTLGFYLAVLLHSNYEVIQAFGGEAKYSREAITAKFIWGEFLAELPHDSGLDSFLLGLVVFVNFLISIGLVIPLTLSWLSLIFLLGGFGLLTAITFMSDHLEDNTNQNKKVGLTKKKKRELERQAKRRKKIAQQKKSSLPQRQKRTKLEIWKVVVKILGLEVDL